VKVESSILDRKMEEESFEKPEKLFRLK